MEAKDTTDKAAEHMPDLTDEEKRDVLRRLAAATRIARPFPNKEHRGSKRGADAAGAAGAKEDQPSATMPAPEEGGGAGEQLRF